MKAKEYLGQAYRLDQRINSNWSRSLSERAGDEMHLYAYRYAP